MVEAPVAQVPPAGDEGSGSEEGGAGEEGEGQVAAAPGDPGEGEGSQGEEAEGADLGEGGEADCSVSVRKLLFPSDNLIRWDALYRGEPSEAAWVDPPVFVDVSFNVTESDNPHTARRMDPTALVNGRILQKEPALNNGKWWGSGTSFKKNLEAIVPSYVEITLPRKRVITHIVIGEDPSLARAETITIDAFIEAREVRVNLADFEKRELARGFWHNVVKFRGNDSPYNVFRLQKPVYTRKLRIYVLAGLTSISEIELYGALPR